MTTRYQICSQTVMDTSDPDIEFDENGVSNHYWEAKRRLAYERFAGSDGEQKLQVIADTIRREGQNKPYDCILGVSGGADSSFVAMRAHELGLRPLAVHLDNGWNTHTAVSNVEALLDCFNFDLHTHVINWNEFKDLQRALFRASVANVEVATDHAITTILYQMARKYDVRFILSGSNVETESILPRSWGHDNRDSRSIKAMKKRFGDSSVGLDTYPLLEPLEFLKSILMNRIRFIPVLNYGSYEKAQAIKKMTEKFGYKSYARKHGESRFTRFFQEYYLPEKFNIDKRRAHFSSMIASGTMKRSDAIDLLANPMYSESAKSLDIEYCSQKLGFSSTEWREIMSSQPRSAKDFPNSEWMFDHNKNPVTKLVRSIAKAEFISTKRDAEP